MGLILWDQGFVSGKWIHRRTRAFNLYHFANLHSLIIRARLRENRIWRHSNLDFIQYLSAKFVLKVLNESNYDLSQKCHSNLFPDGRKYCRFLNILRDGVVYLTKDKVR